MPFITFKNIYTSPPDFTSLSQGRHLLISDTFDTPARFYIVIAKPTFISCRYIRYSPRIFTSLSQNQPLFLADTFDALRVILHRCRKTNLYFLQIHSILSERFYIIVAKPTFISCRYIRCSPRNFTSLSQSQPLLLQIQPMLPSIFSRTAKSIIKSLKHFVGKSRISAKNQSAGVPYRFS